MPRAEERIPSEERARSGAWEPTLKREHEWRRRLLEKRYHRKEVRSKYKNMGGEVRRPGGLETGRSEDLPSKEGRRVGGRSRVYFFFLREPVSSTSLRILSSLSVGSGTTLTSGEILRVQPVLALISSTVAKGK